MKPTLSWGDCRAFLGQSTTPRYHVAFLDPPYGTGNNANHVPKYDTSKYLMTRNWENFHAHWDGPVDWDFTLEWCDLLRARMDPRGNAFICGTHHNIGIVDTCLKRTGWYVVTWIPWVIPNAMPHLAGQRMGAANQIIIQARPNQSPAQTYNDVRAKTWTGNGRNLRDFWGFEPDNDHWEEQWWVMYNESQAVKEMPFLKGFKAKKPRKLVARALDIALPVEEPGYVLDCFAGSGTTGEVARDLNAWTPAARTAPVFCDLVEQDLMNIETFIQPRLDIAAHEIQIVDGSTDSRAITVVAHEDAA